MYLKNDAQQWWYFFVSAFAIISTIVFLLSVWGSFCRWIDDKHWLGSHKGSVLAVAALALWMYGSCLPVFWDFWNMIDDHWQRWYWVKCAMAAVFTIWFSIHALWFLHFRLLQRTAAVGLYDIRLCFAFYDMVFCSCVCVLLLLY